MKTCSILVIAMAMTTLTSCIVSKDGNARVAHDNGKHKGWYKNPNNPHNPATTNPGHTKTTVVIAPAGTTSKSTGGSSGNGKGKKKK